MRRSIIITVVVLFILQLAAQTIIGDGLFEEELLDYVIENYKTTTTLGYTDCRDLMYSEIDLEEGNVLEGIYSGYSIVMDLSVDPSTYAYQNGINCEHSWPQSMGAGSEPQKSDMHHLYPSRAPVNSSRGNSPFAEIDDNQTNKWWKDDFYLISIPEEDIDCFSETGTNQFEPREHVKGNIARSMFYFYAMYQAEADPNFWEIQKDVIYEWHYYDPVDTVESERTWEIAAYQDDCPNPFVVDSTLARRIWFYEPTSNQPEVVPASAKLNNFPNPFNPSTEIVFQLEKQPQEFPTIKIYNIKGQIIKTIEGKSHSKKQSVTWNGRSSANKSVSSGIYFYQLIVDNKVTATSKMLLLE